LPRRGRPITQCDAVKESQVPQKHDEIRRNSTGLVWIALISLLWIGCATCDPWHWVAWLSCQSNAWKLEEYGVCIKRFRLVSRLSCIQKSSCQPSETCNS